MSIAACGGQKRLLDPLELKLQGVANSSMCWQQNSGPLQEQYGLLTAGSSF